MRSHASAALVVVALFLSVSVASVADAETGRCRATIARTATKFVQSKATALSNCERDVVIGKLPPATDCQSEPKAAGLIAKAQTRLRSIIAKSCGGMDKVCGTPDGDDPPAALGWGGVCPNFENGGCTNAIADCDDIADCLLCIGEAAVDQAASLYYDAFVPSAPSSDVNRCQREIGRSATAFLRSKSKALALCWVNVGLGRGTDPCPVPGDGRAANAIAKAEARKIANICHACGGTDETCNGVNDLTPAAIGFVGSCPAVTVPGGGSCAGAITTLQDIVDCVDCVTEFKVDCTDRAAVPWNSGGYPAECNPGAMVTPTRTATPAVTVTPTRTTTPSPTLSTTPAVTATHTTTPTPTVTVTGGVTATRTTTPSPTVTATSALTATRTATPSPTVTSALTATPTRTATATPVLTATRTATPTVVAPTATQTPTPTVTSTPGSTCGNGVLNAGEDCDPAGGAATSCQTASNTGASFTCNPTTCQCACPTKVTFTGNANDPVSLLDTGWTGISHRAPIISNGEVTIGVSGCAGSSRPCGQCNLNGPIANPNAGAGQIDNHRCSQDSSIRCSNNTPCNFRICNGGANIGVTCTVDSQCPGSNCSAPGTCQFYFGSALPLAAGGVTTCVYNQFNGPITGTANIESGESANSANLTARVYTGIAIDNPCPRCVGDGAINDGSLGGTCDGGTRMGQACDGNGTVANRPDFGTTSLDCPLGGGVLIATLPIDLSNATDPVTRTLTAGSPACSGEAGERCLCDTCNTAAAEPCDANSDCTTDPPGVIGPICGGRRCIGGNNAGAACVTVGGSQCLGGTNFGAVCTVASQCPGSSCAALCAPGGGVCGRTGEPTKPSACLDNTATPGVIDCTDTIASGSATDGEGECTQGPVTTSCSVASGHAQRACTGNGECTPGVCEANNRQCFLTGGFSGKNGTNTLIAVGMEDAPMNDAAQPTLGAVFCVGPTGATAVNNVAGLPGPGRVTIRGTATGLP